MRKTVSLVGKKLFSPNIPWRNAPKQREALRLRARGEAVGVGPAAHSFRGLEDAHLASDKTGEMSGRKGHPGFLLRRFPGVRPVFSSSFIFFCLKVRFQGLEFSNKLPTVWLDDVRPFGLPFEEKRRWRLRHGS